MSNAYSIKEFNKLEGIITKEKLLEGKTPAYVSDIEFPHPVKDFEGKENKEIIVYTYCDENGLKTDLLRPDNSILSTKMHGQFLKIYLNLQEDDKKRYEKRVLNTHRHVTNEVKDLHYDKRPIPKNFFELIDFLYYY